MLKVGDREQLGSILGYGSALVSIFLLVGINSDPVNVTKLMILGGLGFATAGIVIFFLFGELVKNSIGAVVCSALFVSSMINAVVLSKSDFFQNYYGMSGRSTGFLTYFLLVLVFLAATISMPIDSYKKYLLGFFAAGIANVIYCGWVLLFGDFVGWRNPYGKILGLLGNPDFVSALLGMFIAGNIAYSLQDNFSLRKRVTLWVTSGCAFFQILTSHAIQGMVVTLFGIAIALFFRLRASCKSNVLPILYICLVSLLGVFAIFGALERGPLSFIHKRSVSLRGSYWQAGINMGLQNPLHGVGMDSYGDWYRSTRPPRALIDLPGVNVMSNVSHNVVIDFFAYGGFPLLISYLLLLTLTVVSLLKFIIRTKSYDPIFVSLATIWLGYQVQSLISINQIGLAIWGWLFGGTLIAYERLTRTTQTQKTSTKTNSKIKNQQIFTPKLIASIFGLAGLLVASPPFNQDVKWFNAAKSRDARQVEVSLKSGILNPVNSMRYLEAVDLFYRSGMQDKALEYSRIAVKKNPHFFDVWRQFYSLNNTPEAERKIALEKMKKLDPNNPDVTQK